MLTKRERELLSLALPTGEDDIECGPGDVDILNSLWGRGLLTRFIGMEGHTVFETTERGAFAIRCECPATVSWDTACQYCKGYP